MATATQTPPQAFVEHCLTAFDLSGCDGPLPMDFNDDCRVDFLNMSKFLESWLDCGLQPPERCFE